jgi:hypothetical protein
MVVISNDTKYDDGIVYNIISNDIDVVSNNNLVFNILNDIDSASDGEDNHGNSSKREANVVSL